MRINILTTIPFPFGNASANRIHSLAKGIISNGIESKVVCLTPNLSEKYSIESEGIYDQVPYKYLPNRAHRPNGFLARRYYRFLGLYKAIIEILFRYNKTTSIILMSVPQYSLLLILFVCRIKGIKIYSEACEYPYLSFKIPAYKMLFLKIFYSPFTGYIFESVPIHLHYNKYIRKDKPVIIIPATQVYDDILAAIPIKKEKYFACCGSLTSEEKDGFMQIINAFMLISKQLDDFKLYIVGRINNNTYHEKLIRLIKELQLESKIFITGEVSREEYVNYLVNTYAFIIGKSANSIHSNLPSSKVVEYLFSGHPILLSKMDGYCDILKDKEEACFIDSNDINDVANSMLYIATNHQVAESIGLNGQMAAYQYFDYKSLTKSLIDFISNEQS